VSISPTTGVFHGQAKSRQWTLSLLGTAHAPTMVTATGVRLTPRDYHWNSSTGTLTITLPERSVHSPITVAFQ